MARIFATGFEVGSVDFLNISNGGDLQTSNPPGPWSSYYYHNASNSYGIVSLPSTASEFYAGFRYLNSGFGGSNPYMVFFLDSSGNQVCRLDDNGSGKVRLLGASGTLADGTIQLSTNHWHYIELYFKSGTSTGAYQTKVDGVTDLALTTGVNTGGSGAVGRLSFLVGTDNRGYLDDLYINDAAGSDNNGFSGDIRVSAYIGNAAGDSSGMSRGGADSGSNYGQVDERPPNDATDYVYGTGTTEKDLYAIPNTSGIATVQSVTQWLRAQKNDAGSANIAHLLKDATTEYVGADIPLSTSWAYYPKVYDKHPDGGSWSTAKLDALQVGAQSR